MSYIGPDAQVYGNAQVHDNAQVYGDAWVHDNARVHDNAQVRDNARVFGDARVYDNAQVRDNARVSGDARVGGDAQVYDNAWVGGNAHIYDNAKIYGTACVRNNAQVGQDADVFRPHHVIVLDGILEEPVTVYRTKDGHRVQAGCQNFTLNDDLRTLAGEHGWALPVGWEALRDAFLIQVEAWHNGPENDPEMTAQKLVEGDAR